MYILLDTAHCLGYMFQKLDLFLPITVAAQSNA